MLDQVKSFVIAADVPSEYIPVALSVIVEPIATVGVAGAIVMLLRLTVVVVVPVLEEAVLPLPPQPDTNKVRARPRTWRGFIAIFTDFEEECSRV